MKDNIIEKSYRLSDISGNSSIKKLVFDIGEADVIPGQFYMIRYNGTQKPISVADYTSGRISFIIQNRGCGTQKILDAQINDIFGLIGPLGNGFNTQKSGSALIVGGGIGIAPLLYLYKQLRMNGIKSDVVFGSRNIDLINFAIINNKSIEYFTDDGTYGSKGFVTDSKSLSGIYHKIYICGPEKMMVAVYNKIKDKNKSIEVSMERYMKCGIGICGSCAIDGTGDRVCTEGPVFNIDSLIKTPEFGNYHRDSGGVIEYR